MANTLSDLASGFGRGIAALGTLGTSEYARSRGERERAEKQQRIKDILPILSGQSIPAFARAGGAEGVTPEQRRQTQLLQLGALGTPEANKLLTEVSPLTQQASSPLSPIGKLRSDLQQGLIDQPTYNALIRKEIAPRTPLVQVGGAAETEGQKVLSKKSAENVLAAQDAGSVAQDMIFNADRLQQAIDQGAVGITAEPKAFLTEVATSFGFDVSPKELQLATNVRSANRILGDKALDKLSTLKGSTSERDLKFGRSVAGRLSEGKGSVQEVADLMKASAIKAQQISEIANNGIVEGRSPREINVEVNRAKNKIKLKDIFEEVKQRRLARQESAQQDLRTLSNEQLLQMLQGAQ